MALSAVFMFIVLLVTGGAGGNDLLDYLPTDAYWKAKGVKPGADAMLAELKPAAAAADAGALIADLGSEDFKIREAATAKLRAMGALVVPQLRAAAEKTADAEVRSRAQGLVTELTAAAKGGEVRRLMAIRTLGELGKAEALPALKGLLDSKELFVADYAQAAIARIEGRPWTRPAPSAEERWSDVWLLPRDSAVVGQLSLPPGGPVDIDKLFKEAREKAGAAATDAALDFDAVKARLADAVLKVAERTGNVRVHTATIGVAENVGNNAGHIGVVIRGVYDPTAVKAALAGLDGTSEQVDGVDVVKFRGGDHGQVLLASRERFVGILGADQKTVDDFARGMLAALKAGKGTLGENAGMAALLKPVKVTDQLWAVARMTDAYRKEEILAGLDSIAFSGRADGGALDFTMTASGKDAEKLKASQAVFEQGRDRALAQIRQLAQQLPALKAAQDFGESIKLEAKAGEVAVRARIKPDLSPVAMMLPMMLMGRGF
ncbi:MAG TPA: hypothetical protein PK280_11035 [Planctomycetota bacterium]|nr:hypothetical protein [Planctomycetota bacterium]